MGIKGLRAALTNQLREGHVKEFATQRVACDGFAWLHKGAFSCAMQLATGQKPTRHLDYCIHMVKMLKFHKIVPVVVLDGAPLPGKSDTNAERAKKRQTQEANGRDLLEQGDIFGATKCFQQSVRITAEMANDLHVRLRAEGVECIVAPYEADAQLAFLARTGQVEAIITEDSDLIPFGVDTVVYKMDRYGNCSILDKQSILGGGKPALDIAPLNFEQRLHLCILAGCDYLPSIPGIGIKKAFALIKEHKDGFQVIQHLRKPAKKGKKAATVPDGYEDAFRKAEVSFKCHRVYDHSKKRVVHLSPLPDLMDFDAAEVLGPAIPDELAVKLCWDCSLNPRTHAPFKLPSSAKVATKSPNHLQRKRNATRSPAKKVANQPVISGLLTAASKKLPDGLLAMMAAAPSRSQASESPRDEEGATRAVMRFPSGLQGALEESTKPDTLPSRQKQHSKPFSIKDWFSDAAQTQSESGQSGGNGDPGHHGEPKPLEYGMAIASKTPATKKKENVARRRGGPLDAFFSASLDATEQDPSAQQTAQVENVAGHPSVEIESCSRRLTDEMAPGLSSEPPQRRAIVNASTGGAAKARKRPSSGVLFSDKSLKRKRSGPLDAFAVPSAALR